MADLQATYTLPTDPKIKFTVTSESKRSGTTVYYRLKISTAPITGASYFGYNLKCTAVIAGKTVASSVTLKDASPMQWSSARTKYLPSSTGWYSVTGITSATTVSASIKFFSTQVSQTISSGTRTLAVPAGTAPSGVKLSLSSSKGLRTSSITLTASVGSWGDSGTGKYIYSYSSDGSTWKTLASTQSSSTSFKPSSYGFANGSIAYFRVQAINARSLKTTSSSVKYTCVSAPSAPTNLAAAPTSGKRTDAITLTWSGSAAGYNVRVRYSSDGGKSWTSWSQLDSTMTSPTRTTTPSNYTAFTVYDAAGTLQYAVRAKSSYGLYSGWSSAISYSVVPSSSSQNVKIKLNGAWKTASAVYIKLNGKWVKAKKVYVKVNGTWK